jgi:hypothetical protein
VVWEESRWRSSPREWVPVTPRSGGVVPVLVFAEEWTAFVAGVCAGEFDPA